MDVAGLQEDCQHPLPSGVVERLPEGIGGSQQGVGKERGIDDVGPTQPVGERVIGGRGVGDVCDRRVGEVEELASSAGFVVVAAAPREEGSDAREGAADGFVGKPLGVVGPPRHGHVPPQPTLGRGVEHRAGDAVERVEPVAAVVGVGCWHGGRGGVVQLRGGGGG